MGSKSSSSASQQLTQNYDQRQVNSWTIDDRDEQNSYDLSDNRQTVDNSIQVLDSRDMSDRSTWANWQDQSISVADSRDLSTHYSDSSSYANWQDQSISVADSRDLSQTYIVNADSERIAAMNAELLRDLSADQTDGMKTVAGFGFDALQRMGASATDLYETAGANAVRSFDLATARATDAWEATTERSAGLIESLLAGAQNTVQAARGISEAAISSFQPTDNKTADAMKWAALAAAGVAAFVLLPKLTK